MTAKVIRCSIDDKEVVAVNYEGRTVSTRVEVSANRPLGFASYETAGAIRKVEMRKLSAEEIKAADAVE